MSTTRHVVTWAVNVYDSRKKPPFPLDVKHVVLDWNKVPAEELPELKLVLQQNDREHCVRQPERKQTVVTMSWNTPLPFDSRLHKFRKYFVERSPLEIDQELNAPGATFVRMQSLFFPEQYVEDESGAPLEWLEMMDRAAGGPVLIHGDVRSVLRFGPAKLKEKQAWQQRDSDLLQQFLSIV